MAPTSAEYRVLGANEPFLSAVRTATGGSVVETPLDPWRHDLTLTNRFTDLWPLLLVLALLLWPLDIALRRVSIGRREFAAAGAWVRGIGGRRGRVAARTATGEGLLAARERATSTGARAAMRAESAGEVGGEGSTPGQVQAPTAPTPSIAVAAPDGAPRAPTPDAIPAAIPDAQPDLAAPAPDTMARLRDAKRRARDR